MDTAQFDENYIRRLKEGDRAAENHFGAHFGDLLFLRLRGRVRSRQLLADVRQETLLRVLQAVRAGELEHAERLGAFVFAVANNVLMEFLRAEARYETKGLPPEPIDERIGVDQELINAERKRQVAQVLAELSEKDREVLRMSYFGEGEREEFCRRFGVAPDHLRVVLHRAKSRFREKFMKGTRKAAGG